MSFNEIEQDILLTLMYYDIFSYPLRLEEIVFCSKLTEINIELIESTANQLVQNQQICLERNFYSLQKSSEWIDKRLENNVRAAEMMPRARWVSQFIGNFPYVRAVFLSGSISKNVFAKDADIDYFILTEPQRLWFARTLLIAFRRIVLLNSHKYFCVNYFLDTENVEIEDKNLFSATELAYLIPTYGAEYYQPLMQKNAWYRRFFPHFPLRNIENVPYHHKNFFKKSMERLFDGKIGNFLDETCMRITLYYRRKKFGSMGKKEFEIALKARKYVSKHHPNHFQKRVEVALAERKKRYNL